MADEQLIYIVGSNERKFIVDRVDLDRQLAIDYCEQRNQQNKESGDRQWWIVMSSKPGDYFNDWLLVHPLIQR